MHGDERGGLYAAPKLKKDRSGFLVRSSALLLMSAAAAMTVYLMNAPTAARAPVEEPQMSAQASERVQWRSFEDLSSEDAVETPNAPAPASAESAEPEAQDSLAAPAATAPGPTPLPEGGGTRADAGVLDDHRT